MKKSQRNTKRASATGALSVFLGVRSTAVRLLAGAAALCAGALQALLDTVLFPAAFAAKPGRMLSALFGKLVLYGGLLALLAFPMRAGIFWGAAGYAVGFFPYLAVWYMKKGKTLTKGGR